MVSMRWGVRNMGHNIFMLAGRDRPAKMGSTGVTQAACP